MKSYMSKVLHASYSGYFPFCTQQGTPSSSKEYLSLTLLEAMTLFWRVKIWEVKVTGQLNFTYQEAPEGRLQSITYPNDSFFECEARGTNIATEEDFVCVQDADNFVFASIGRLASVFSFYDDPDTIPNSFIQFFQFRFTTLDELIITDGSNFYVNFESSIPAAASVVTKDEERFPENTKIVGSYSISFGGFTKNGNLYGPADGDESVSGDLLLEIRAKEYWSYGGTYDTTTGEFR